VIYGIPNVLENIKRKLFVLVISHIPLCDALFNVSFLSIHYAQSLCGVPPNILSDETKKKNMKARFQIISAQCVVSRSQVSFFEEVIPCKDFVLPYHKSEQDNIEGNVPFPNVSIPRRGL